jgi:hypothetical protein
MSRRHDTMTEWRPGPTTACRFAFRAAARVVALGRLPDRAADTPTRWHSVDHTTAIYRDGRWPTVRKFAAAELARRWRRYQEHLLEKAWTTRPFTVVRITICCGAPVSRPFS